ncbi:DUF4190 domain-containing protein [Rathayibacter sp. VKM Ac-2927]|uniref:DUF4190 domain-containing protein n=1 Tax=Rathayibacter sp. VKM Ac-2927 TaxID=2929478 RepID=UPI001FB4AD2A|nr:DUF4190 domain-containing protein [Rathayibacter sp. VKM Ac-2927]MCJ1688583.1 DUF4190 domain-containing protein [Rathayibacter sp. VKM Ac-2927]
MVSPTELRLTVPLEQARALIAAALGEQGFAAVSSAGGLDVSRGSLGTTLVAGSLAGEDMHVRFDIDLAATATGTIAQVRRSSLGGFLKGGAIGAAKANDVVQDAVHRLGTRLAEQGVLEGFPADPSSSDATTGIALPARSGGASVVPPPVDYAGRKNVVAIVALVLGFLVPIGGIIAGAVALAQIRRTKEKGRGLAIAGIAVGSALIVVAIVAGILLVVFGVTAAQQAEQAGPVVMPPTVTSSPFADETTPAAQDPESVDVFSVQVGDCLNDSGVDEVSTVEIIDCAAPHDFEVFAEFPIPGDTFPGADQVDTAASEGCLAAFPDFVGLTYEESTLDYSYFSPTQESWQSNGDRLVSCLIIDPNTQTIGTLSGANR